MKSMYIHTYLDQKLFPPVIEILKWFGGVDIIDKYTAVSTTVKSYSKALEPFLTSSVPYLLKKTQDISSYGQKQRKQQKSTWGIQFVISRTESVKCQSICVLPYVWSCQRKVLKNHIKKQSEPLERPTQPSHRIKVSIIEKKQLQWT